MCLSSDKKKKSHFSLYFKYLNILKQITQVLNYCKYMEIQFWFYKNQNYVEYNGANGGNILNVEVRSC